MSEAYLKLILKGYDGSSSLVGTEKLALTGYLPTKTRTESK